MAKNWPLSGVQRVCGLEGYANDSENGGLKRDDVEVGSSVWRVGSPGPSIEQNPMPLS